MKNFFLNVLVLVILEFMVLGKLRFKGILVWRKGNWGVGFFYLGGEVCFRISF